MTACTRRSGRDAQTGRRAGGWARKGGRAGGRRFEILRANGGAKPFESPQVEWDGALWDGEGGGGVGASRASLHRAYGSANG